MPVEDDRLQGCCNILEQLAAFRGTIEAEYRLHPFAVCPFNRKFADPFLMRQEILEAFRHIGRLHEIGVELRHAVARINTVPALIRIARFGHDVLGIGRLELQRQIVRDHVDGAGVVDIPRLLARARLEGNLGEQG